MNLWTGSEICCLRREKELGRKKQELVATNQKLWSYNAYSIAPETLPFVAKGCFTRFSQTLEPYPVNKSAQSQILHRKTFP